MPDDYSLEHIYIERTDGVLDKCWFCGESYKKHKPNERMRAPNERPQDDKPTH